MAHRAKHLTEEKKLIAKTQAKNKALNAGGHGDKFGPPWKSEKLKNKEEKLIGTGIQGFRNSVKYWGKANPKFADGSDSLANNKFQYLQFYHVPSGESVAFKAFILSFSDDYQSEWNAETVYGRMDPIATFKRTGRTINATFTVPASGFQEAVENMMRMTALTQFLYPSYEGSTIKGAPFIKVQFMNWIQNSEYGPGSDPKESGLLGYINGFSFQPNMEAGVFQSGLDILPKEMSVNFQLNVIHEAPLGWSRQAADGALQFGGGFDEFPYGLPTGKTLAYTSESMTSVQQTKHDEIVKANISKILDFD